MLENTVYVAISHQMALQQQMDVVAHNIANASTTSFKAEHVVFSEYLQDVDEAEQMSLVQDIASVPDLTEGTLKGTGNPFDLAIRNDGYFRIDTPNEVSYTRNGHFQLDTTGTLVTADGHAVLTVDGQPIITVPGDIDVTIADDGTVSSANGVIGRIDVVTFENPYLLTRMAATLYTTEQVPLPAIDYKILQGMLEDSNVEPIIKMTRMIELVRSYQNTKSLLDDQHELARNSIEVLATNPQ